MTMTYADAAKLIESAENGYRKTTYWCILMPDELVPFVEALAKVEGILRNTIVIDPSYRDGTLKDFQVSWTVMYHAAT